MARNGKHRFHRSLDLLGNAVGLAIQLGERAGNTRGRVGVLRHRLERARSELDAHRQSKPLDVRHSRQLAERVLQLTVEYITEVLAVWTEEN